MEKGSARIVWWLTKIKPRTSEGVLKSETWHWLWWAVSVFLQWQGCRVRIQRQCCAIPQPHLAEAHTSETDVRREHRLADKPQAPPLCSELAFGCRHCAPIPLPWFGYQPPPGRVPLGAWAGTACLPTLVVWQDISLLSLVPRRCTAQGESVLWQEAPDAMKSLP